MGDLSNLAYALSVGGLILDDFAKNGFRELKDMLVCNGGVIECYEICESLNTFPDDVLDLIKSINLDLTKKTSTYQICWLFCEKLNHDVTWNLKLTWDQYENFLSQQKCVSYFMDDTDSIRNAILIRASKVFGLNTKPKIVNLSFKQSDFTLG